MINRKEYNYSDIDHNIEIKLIIISDITEKMKKYSKQKENKKDNQSVICYPNTHAMSFKMLMNLMGPF